MKVFKCKDGNNRVFSKREKAFSANEMATMVVAKFVYEDNPVKEAKKLKSKTAILDVVWDEIFSSGFESPFYSVGDNLGMRSDEIVEEVETHIKKVFKNLS